jgi:hypothetical protein
VGFDDRDSNVELGLHHIDALSERLNLSCKIWKYATRTVNLHSKPTPKLQLQKDKSEILA